MYHESDDSKNIPPSWITRERPDWKLVSHFPFGQQSPVQAQISAVSAVLFKRMYQRSKIHGDF